MKQGGILIGSKKYLAWVGLALLTFLVLLSPKAYAGAESGGGRACSTSSPPTPYTNGAPIVRAFYPADGSTVTVTSTGAVIKQSPCQTAYREGWVNPADICKLNSFGDLGGMINQSDNNPYPNTAPVYSCGTAAPAPTPNPSPPPATTTPVATSTSTSTVSSTNLPARPDEKTIPVVQSQTTSTPSPAPAPAPAAPALPNTGPSGVVAVGGISTVLGTVGHFFYRRRAFN